MIHGLPEKIKELRRKSNYSQHEIAKKLDVSDSIISGYETGERTPSVENLLALARLFRCSTDYLLGRDEEPDAPALDVEGLSARQIKLLSELIDTMRT